MISILCCALLTKAAFGREAAVPKQVNVWVSQNVAPSSKIRLSINTRNVPVVHVSVFPFDGMSWYRKKHAQNDLPRIDGQTIKQFYLTVAQKGQRNDPTDNYYSRQVNLPPMKSGSYLLRFEGGQASAQAIVNVTDLNVIVRRSAYHSLAWVTNFKTGQPIAGAQLDFCDIKGTSLASGVSKPDGTWFTAQQPGWRRLLVRQGTELAFVDTMAPNPNGRLHCLFQTDRPIYRPGQTISFKAILRATSGQGYRNLSNVGAIVQLRDPKDNPLDQMSLTSNATGSVDGHFRIPQEGMLGPYSLVLSTINQRAYQTVSVAAYRKPEFKVDVTSPAKRYFSGQDVHFTVNASYLFGAPVQQAAVDWVVRRSVNAYTDSEGQANGFYGGDGNLYPSDNYRFDPVVGDGHGVTNNQGLLDITVHSKPNAPDETFSVELTVRDASNRVVTSSSSVPVFSSNLRIGLNCLKQIVGIGEIEPVAIRVVDLDGVPRAAQVKLQLIRLVWNEKEGKEIENVLMTRSIAVPSNGRATVSVPGLADGELILRAKANDSSGRTAYSAMSFTVQGLTPDRDEPKPEPMVELKLEKHSYKPGERVRAFITTNRPKRPILMTYTGGDIWSYAVVSAKGGRATWSVTTTSHESPNGYINANQWCENGGIGSNALVAIPDASKELTVQVQSEKPEYRPGDRAKIRVRTLDASGKPISAEVALSVVDEAIYLMSEDATPDPYTFYWGQRGDQVTFFESSPEEVSGGAFQRANSLAPVRRRFEDTAFWDAHVRTNAQGVAESSFEVPGNLTTWRVTGRAITSATEVGYGRASILASRPVTLRLATPRVLSQGDTFTLTGTIDNRSTKALDTVVSLDCPAAEFETAKTQSVHIGPKGEATAKWHLSTKVLPTTGVLSFTASVATPALDDPDYGDALEVSVPIVPRGLLSFNLIGTSVKREQDETLQLPSDTFGQGSVLVATLSGGFGAKCDSSARNLLRSGHYGTMWAVNALKAAAVAKVQKDDEAVKEALALLSRSQSGDGWGWWDQAPSDPKITAEVAYTLALASAAGFTVYEPMKNFAIGACQSQFARTNLWEDKALLSAALVLLGGEPSIRFANEVLERGVKVSPFAKLRLAECLSSGHRDRAMELVDQVMPLVSSGPSSAYIPVGPGIGWTASQTQTTAQLLIACEKLGVHPELRGKLARRLVLPEAGQFPSSEDVATTILALNLYRIKHPDASSIGTATISINGHSFPLTHSTVSESAQVVIRDAVVGPGANQIRWQRDGDGEAFGTLEVRSYRQQRNESIHGVRVVRRYEVLNEAGVWTEIMQPIKANQPIRCTVIVWGDDLPDALRVTEPLPAGFEYVDGDYTQYGYQEVRDGAVVHYLLNSGTPVYVRYYLRAEAEGRLVALPAVAEYLRRPDTRGNTALTEMVVHP